MLARVSSVLFVFLQVEGSYCTLLVYPKDVSATVGDFVSFQCITNTIPDRRGAIQWIFTTERDNFLQYKVVYAFRSVFPEWRDRFNVTESGKGHFTLSIFPVNRTDFGFYTCLDNGDDSKATAELRMKTGEADADAGSSLGPRVKVTSTSYFPLGPEKRIAAGHEWARDETTDEILFETQPSRRSMAYSIALSVSLGSISILAILVLTLVCHVLRNRTKTTKKHNNRVAVLQNVMTNEAMDQVSNYDVIPVYEEVNRLVQSTQGARNHVVAWNDFKVGFPLENEKDQNTSGYATLHREFYETPVYASLQ